MPSDDAEMQEIDPSEEDLGSEKEDIDSGHASDNGSEGDVRSFKDDDDAVSESASIELRDIRDQMKKKAKERLRKCLVFLSEFWKIILFLLQTGILGGMGLLAYYMKFTDMLPMRDTLFDCYDENINQHYNITVFKDFAFGNQIKEEWMYVFSWMAPPGMTLIAEFFYSLHTGCSLSPHLKTPLIIRRCCRIIGVEIFGQVATLIISESMKLFITSPRPYFIDLCKPNSTDCHQANQNICTEQDAEILRDARTSFPSMPIAALSYSCFFVGAYFHQMAKHGKAFILQPLMALGFVVLALLGGGIEVGISRSHWWDVLAGYCLGITMAAYMVFTLNYFVEKFPPKESPKHDDMWIQTDPEPEEESDDEYPYEQIMTGKLPKRKYRYLDEGACFHRATSFDSTFQSDLARSLNMFKTLNSSWTSAPRAPVFDVSRGFYDQPLPTGLTTLNETDESLRETKQLSQKVGVYIKPPSPPPAPSSPAITVETDTTNMIRMERAQKNWRKAKEATIDAARFPKLQTLLAKIKSARSNSKQTEERETPKDSEEHQFQEKR